MVREQTTLTKILIATTFCFVAVEQIQLANAQIHTIHQFGVSYNGADPEEPLAVAPNGVIYGVTSSGGTGPCNGPTAQGCGTVYSLTPPASSTAPWKPATIARFGTAALPGFEPLQGLAIDSAGNLYGTTLTGTKNGCGTIFELTAPTADKSAWGKKVLHIFAATTSTSTYPNANADGCLPQGGAVVLDNAGNLYGTTSYGGPYGAGVVYKLNHPVGPGDHWTYKVLYGFGRTGTGQFITGSVLFDSLGNIYGMANGTSEAGNIFKLSPPSSTGQLWNETVLHAFAFSGDPLGYSPIGLAFDGKGGLLASTFYGDTNDGNATTFDLTPSSSGAVSWTSTLLANIAMTNLSIIDNSIYGNCACTAGNLAALVPLKAGGYKVEVVSTGPNTGGSNSGLTPGLDGEFYGSLVESGSKEFGSIFRFKPN